jgi:hypothetical protein
MENPKLLETLADISYIAGSKNIFTGDSRVDVSTFIYWANEFEKAHSETNWDEEDYISTIEEFTTIKLRSLR